MSSAALQHPISVFDQSMAALPAKLNNVPQDYRELKSLFMTLRQEDEAFKQSIKVSHYKARTCVASAQDLSEKMYLLIKGRVHLVCKNEQTGVQIVITTLEPGAIFGQGSVSGLGGKSLKFVEAMDNVTLWSIPTEAATAVILRYPILSWGLLQTYAARLAQVEDRLEAVAHKKLPARLAELLLKLSDQNHELHGVSHQTLADHLGTYRETVSSILRNFKQEGLLVLGYRRIRLLNLPLLEEIAGFW
jgi:CRP/FNR family transcriptional regulator, cyclic AMP receptor protein